MKRISAITSGLLFAGLLFADIALVRGDDGILVTPPSKDLFSQYESAERPDLQPGSFNLSPDEIEILARAKPGAKLNLPSLDTYTENLDDPLIFKRVAVYAPGAEITVVGDQGTYRISPAARSFFMASNSSTSIGLAVNRSRGSVNGYAIKGASQMEVRGDMSGSIGFTTSVHPKDAETSCGTELGDQPPQAVEFLTQGGGFKSQDDTRAPGINWQAVVAVDTDTEWMSGKGNNTSTATTWIETLFLTMNVMYERDVNTRLLIGDTMLRVGSDPWTVGANSTAQLDEFAEYWRINRGSIDRDFAAALSGKIGSGSFSGVAWINQYCQKGIVPNGWTKTVGSYSMNRVGTNWSAEATAKFFGHELGHNMGSPHTHCISNNQGGFIDQCYNQGGDDCYAGGQSCPGAGSGTTMSYCHLLGGCGSTAGFHPIVQTLLEDRLASNSPSCIAPFENPDPPQPSISIVKEVSVNGGSQWFNANNPGSAPDVDFPSGAEYRISVANNGEVDLTDVSFSDSDLGIINHSIGNLNINASVVLTSSSIPALGPAQICNSEISVQNSATVSARSADDGSDVGPESDDAYVNCIAPTPSLTVTHEVSVDGGVIWADANGVGAAPKVDFPASARYRVTVENDGEVDLENVLLSIPGLGIANHAVGEIEMGNSTQIDSNDLSELDPGTECVSTVTVSRTASVTGESVADSSVIGPILDPAMLNCFAPPTVNIETQISTDDRSPWETADSAASAPRVLIPGAAFYRIVISNNGQVDLVNVMLDDPSLGVLNYSVGALDVGSTVELDSADIPALAQPTACVVESTVVNSASVVGESVETGTVSSPVEDSAYLICEFSEAPMFKDSFEP